VTRAASTAALTLHDALPILLIGAEAARRLGWRIGETVRLPGLRDQSGTVAGILAPTGGADDTFIHLRLGAAQRLFKHTNELTHRSEEHTSELQSRVDLVCRL